MQINNFKQKARIQTIFTNRIFEISSLIQDNQIYKIGKILFTSGHNQELKMEIANIIERQKIILMAPMPFTIEQEDNIEITAGCSKTFKMCSEIYQNAVNFRGEPHIPSNFEVL